MKPQIGNIVMVRGVKCRIFKIHPAGAIDVEEVNGPGAWRLSGLPASSTVCLHKN